VEIPSLTVVKDQIDAQNALAADEADALDRSRKVSKGYHKIASFKHKNINYNLYETPASEAESIVNLWTSEELQENAELVRGKPFTRYFVALQDILSTSAQYATGPIPFMPMGYNTLFEPKPIELPIGVKNPYKTDSSNIMRMHRESEFQFTSGNMAATAAANLAYLNPEQKQKTKTVKDEPKEKKQKKDEVKSEVKVEKSESSTTKKDKKKDKKEKK